MATESLIRTDAGGGLATLVLDRPRAINALNHQMIVEITAALEEWAEDDSVEAVLLTGAGERGLCAGGDIKEIYASIRADEGDAARFWELEYAVNLLISQFPKPYIAILDGITMGGGLGISAHGSHRVVTETSTLAMPETGIGLFPDVGITHLFARMPHQVGVYLALTGQTIGGSAAVRYGLADAVVAQSRIEDLVHELHGSPADPDAVLGRYAEPLGVDELAADLGWIESAFAHDSVQEILTALDAGAEKEQDCAAFLRTRSPSALVATLAAVRSAEHLDLASTLAQDLRLATLFTKLPDLAEGIRAQVIDKDRHPAWNPADLESVDVAAINAALEG